MARIFLSYSRRDEPFARRLAGALSNMGADIWIDVEDIPAGMKWSSAIQQGLDEGDLLIVIISPDSMASRNVEDEWQYYLDHGKPIVPVLLEPAKINFQLNRLQYIDFHVQAFDIAINQLYAELRRKGLTLDAPAQPRQPSGQPLPDFDRMTPEEIDRVLAELQKRRQQFDPAAPVLYPQPRPARSSNHLWVVGAGLAVAGILLLTAVFVLPGLNQSRGTATPPAATEAGPPSEVALGGMDTDGDGLSDADELEHGTDPESADTDGDGLPDGTEINDIGSDPLNTDTDEDDLSDAEEVNDKGTNPLSADSDEDSLSDSDEVNDKGTNPLSADSDEDGLSDSEEINDSQTNPNQYDTDGDGKSDGEEVNNFGTDPLDSDTDDDGLDDGDEILGCTSPTNADSDDDGIDDHTEAQEGTACAENTPVPLGFSADNPVTSNADWSPILRTFGDIKMALVPTGTFIMGTSPDDFDALYADCERYISNCRGSSRLFDDEAPQQEVAFDTPFWISVYEMTNWQIGRSDDGLPVTNVTWVDAQQYCERLGMRLPTEREWEYASRGPDSLDYPWGDEFPGAIFNYCDEACSLNVGWKDTAHLDGFPELAPVGSFSDSGSWIGAHDMAGNVWEWTSTVYHNNPEESHEAPDDLEQRRVLKGGSWNWILLEGRGAARSPYASNYPASPWYGFRCAKDFDPSDLS
jgi:formylglycine-generating enzyme required for sulfatase activity